MSRDLEALLQFLNQPNTDYAYMLTGEWGSGKTYFWKEIVVPELAKAGGKDPWHCVYLPLHAVSSSEEIRRSLIAQLHPKIAAIGASIGLLGPAVAEYLPIPGAVRRFASDAFNWLSKGAGTGSGFDCILRVLGHTKRLVICFDDLERAELAPERLLADINQFVEHLGAKVVILCNERDILDRKDASDYKRAKEKVVRVTRTYSATPEDVLTAIIAQFSSNDGFHGILLAHREEILSIFRRSTVKNFRILKYALLNLEIACGAVAECIPGDNQAMLRLIRTLLPVTLEVRRTEGGITLEQAAQFLREGSAAVMRTYAADDKTTPLQAFGERHDLGFFGTQPWVSPALAELVTSGHLDRSALRAEIAEEQAEQTEGKRAVSALLDGWWKQRDEDLVPVINAALAAVRSGEVAPWSKLHNLAVALEWMSNEGFLDIPLNELAAAFDAGIQALVDRGAFHLVEPWRAGHEITLGEKAGQLPRAVREKLLETNKKVNDRIQRQQIRTALDQLDGEDNAFSTLICDSERGGIADREMATFVSAQEFVDRILNTDNAAKTSVRHAIDRRYQNNPHLAEIAADIPWLEEVQDRLQEPISRVPKEKRLTAYLLNLLLKSVREARDRLKIMAQNETSPPSSGSS